MIFITENDYDEIINHHCDKSLMQKTDSFSGITAFVAAAQHGSFTAAADKLGITKSAAGKRISQLEAALGVSLFQRGNRRITLTPARKNISPAASLPLPFSVRRKMKSVSSKPP